ncbi:MAG: zinc ribbon domain-containing protein [Bacilli bacterium]|nr:zinc ribbon domain-containing protein [Bacilli bacterium]
MFCGNCGTKLKDGKCPKCDKTETKKVTKATKVEEPKNEKVNSFGWGVLGFFFPIAGLILFIVFFNKKKGISKASGIGALISVGVDIITTFSLFIGLPAVYRSISNYMICGEYNSSYNACKRSIEDIFDDDLWDDEDEDEDEDDDIIKKDDGIHTIEMTDINTNIGLDKKTYEVKSLKELSANKTYDDRTYSLNFSNNKFVLSTVDTKEILKVFDNVKKVYYNTHDCSGLEFIVVVTDTKAYYINTYVHVTELMKFVELKGNYVDFYAAPNHGYTCGGSSIALGKTASGAYVDLNGEQEIDLNVIHYYDSPISYIAATREYRVGYSTGSAKVLITASETDTVLGIVDVNNKAYKYSYDNGGQEETALLDPISNIDITPANVVTKIVYDENKNTVSLVFDNGKDYTFEYAALDY